MVAFINNYTAVEVSIGVLGVNLSKKRQVTNQVETGETVVLLLRILRLIYSQSDWESHFICKHDEGIIYKHIFVGLFGMFADECSNK